MVRKDQPVLRVAKYCLVFLGGLIASPEAQFVLDTFSYLVNR